MITHGEAFAVQPFSNIVTTKTFTGAQIKTILEQQFVTSANAATDADPARLGRVLVLVDGIGADRQQGQQHDAERQSDLARQTAIASPPTTSLPAAVMTSPASRWVPAEQTGLDDLVALENISPRNDPYTPIVTPSAPNRITTLP